MPWRQSNRLFGTSFNASTEEVVSNRDAFIAIIDRGFSKGDLSIADEICANDLVEHQYPIKPHLLVLKF